MFGDEIDEISNAEHVAYMRVLPGPAYLPRRTRNGLGCQFLLSLVKLVVIQARSLLCSLFFTTRVSHSSHKAPLLYHQHPGPLNLKFGLCLKVSHGPSEDAAPSLFRYLTFKAHHLQRTSRSKLMPIATRLLAPVTRCFHQ